MGWATESNPTQVSDTLNTEVVDRLADPECAIVSHSKYDPVFMKRAGHKVTGPYHDTMVMAHLLDENTRLDLDSCVEHYTGFKMDKRLKRSDKRMWFTTDGGDKLLFDEAWSKFPEQVMDYCRRDVEATVSLYHTLRHLMDERGWTNDWQHEHVPFTGILVDMECAGLPINLDEAKELRNTLEHKAAEQERKLIDDLGYEINFDSPTQLRTVLYSKLWKQGAQLEITKEQRDCLRSKCSHDSSKNTPTKEPNNNFTHYEPPSHIEVTKVGTKFLYGEVLRKGLNLTPKVKTDSGLWSTSTPVLTVYYGNHPIVADLIAYRKTNKVINTYLKAYPEYTYEDKLFGRFNQTGTATGRLSHSNPNLGNQPAHGELGLAIRGLFQGRLLIGDHSQLEPRLMAHCSGDPVLTDIYRSGKDIYLVTAEYIFGRKVTKEDEERQICKTLILALGYGAAAPKLAQILAINGFWTSVDEAAQYLKELSTLYKTFFAWKKHVQRTAKAIGYVKTIGGRYRRLRWAYNSKTFRVRNKADRQAVNAIIQGSAADILRRNMLHCVSAFPDLPLLNQVHDELLWDATHVWGDSAILAELEKICESPGYSLDIPLKFEPNYCPSWAEKGVVLDLPDEDIEDED